MSEPFNSDELATFVSALEQDSAFLEWHNTYLPNWRALRNRKATINIPGISEILKYHSPAVGSDVDRYRNRLRASKIRILVAAKDAKSQAAAQAAENWFYALYHDFRIQDDVDDEALDFQAADGLGPRNITFTNDVMEKIFAKAEGATIEDLPKVLEAAFSDGFDGNPFKLRVPNPDILFWDKNKSMVAEIGVAEVTSLRLAYEDEGILEDDEKVKFDQLVSDTFSRDGADPTRTVPFWHVETNKYIYEAIVNSGNDETIMLRVLPNPVGRPGYTFAAGHRTSGRMPWEAYKPLVGDLLEPVQHLNINRTLLATAALQTGRPRYQQVKDGGRADDYLTVLSRPANDENVVSIDTASELASLPVKDGYHWEPIPIPDTRILNDAVAAGERDIVKYGFPISLDPSGSTSATSGYDRALEQQGAQDFLEPALANNAAAWKEIFLQCADAIKKAKVPVTITTMLRAQGESERLQDKVKIEPDQLKDIHIEVRFESITATTQFALDAASREDVAMGYKSKTRYMGEKYDDPIRELKQVDLDLVGDAARKLAVETAITGLRAQAEPMLSQLQAELNIPPTAVEEEDPAFKQSRPEGGAMPGEGAPPVPPVQSQNGGVPATGGGAVGAS